MNPLQRALIDKARHDHGFKYVLRADDDAVHLASARHRAHIRVVQQNGLYNLAIISSNPRPLSAELSRTFLSTHQSGANFVVSSHSDLVRFIQRAAELAHALPNQTVDDFEAKLEDELATFPAELIKGTEVERLVRQRVGQQTFRQAMLQY